jgi:tripartite-type tricarboxylate transporter receptor subunit TctC
MNSTDTNNLFPSREITLIVGFPPGGSLGLTAEPLVETLNKYLPQKTRITYRPGESGTIGMAELLESPADGYTLNMGAMGLLTLQPHIRSLPYNTVEDYTPIISLVNNPVGIAVRNDSPWNTIEEFIAYAKENPGKIRVADLGMGSALHLATEQMKEATGIDISPVHLNGSPACVQALTDGEVEAVTNHHAVFIEGVKEGLFRVIGVFERNRNSLFPETQTFLEVGYEVIFDSYACLIGPKNLPEHVVGTLHDACKKVMEDPEFVKPMEEKGLDLFYQGPDQLAEILKKDYETNARLIKYIN